MQTIKPSSNFTGDYSRFSSASAAAKRYIALLKEKGKAVLDDDFNYIQDVLLTLIRQHQAELLGDGSPNAGFQIVGGGAANDFTIKGGDGTVDGAGVIYVNGLRLILPSDTTYLAQELAPPALTTPSGARTDTVYLDVWLDEIGPDDDPEMVDPTLAYETSRRLKLYWQVLVAQGGLAPDPYTDADDREHSIVKLATLQRTATASIISAMVTDERVDLSVTASATALMADHIAAANPHDQYLLEADAPTLYAGIGAPAAAASAATAAHNTDPTAHPGTFVSLNVPNSFTKGQAVTSVTIALNAGAYNTDASLSNVFKVAMTGNGSLSNPTNMLDGQTLIWRFKQDATGGRTITSFGNKFSFGIDGAPLLSTSANAVDIMSGTYFSDTGMIECSFRPGE